MRLLLHIDCDNNIMLEIHQFGVDLLELANHIVIGRRLNQLTEFRRKNLSVSQKLFEFDS